MDIKQFSTISKKYKHFIYIISVVLEEKQNETHWWNSWKEQSVGAPQAATTDEINFRGSVGYRRASIVHNSVRGNNCERLTLLRLEALPRSRVISEGVEKQIYTAFQRVDDIRLLLLSCFSVASFLFLLTKILLLEVVSFRNRISFFPAALWFKYVLMNYGELKEKMKMFRLVIYYLPSFEEGKMSECWKLLWRRSIYHFLQMFHGIVHLTNWP